MTPAKLKNGYLILILGVLTALCPFSIDMYLPAFIKIAGELQIPVSEMSLTLSSFFVGMASGQLFYGPLLDRFGRKRPLYTALSVYILASFGCVTAHSLRTLVIFRFIQALGGCGANVAAMAMVRDFFSGKESAKVFALLILILGASPLLAPSVGGFMATAFGWKSIFLLLAAICALMLAVCIFFLPEGHPADPSHSLHPAQIAKGYLTILKEPQFYTYAAAASFALAGLFIYLPSSPVIFMEIFHVSPIVYGWIFGLVAMGFVGCSQLNFIFLRHFTNEQILRVGLISLTIVGIIFFIGSYENWYGIRSIIFLLFLFLSSFGVANPNASALALAPFKRNAGSASALLGFVQMALGSLASVAVGILNVHQICPVAGLFAATGILALLALFLGEKQIVRKVEASPDETVL